MFKYFNTISPEAFASEAASKDIDLEVFEALFKAFGKQDHEVDNDIAIKKADPAIILQTDLSKDKPSERFLKETAVGVIDWLSYCRKKEFKPSAQLLIGKV